MSRRFSDEPINLIHRIPTPEQLSAVRPKTRSFSQVIGETGAACVRAVAEVFAQVRRLGPTAIGASAISHVPVDAQVEPIASAVECLDERVEQSAVVLQRPRAVASPSSKRDVSPPQSVVPPAAVQPEEVAELRAYLLSQQQDIARLSAQIQELKSLAASQQQVLVYLGKELEASSLSSMTAGIASAPAKRNGPVRQKPGMKDKAVAQKNASKPSSLSF